MQTCIFRLHLKAFLREPRLASDALCQFCLLVLLLAWDTDHLPVECSPGGMEEVLRTLLFLIGASGEGIPSAHFLTASTCSRRQLEAPGWIFNVEERVTVQDCSRMQGRVQQQPQVCR